MTEKEKRERAFKEWELEWGGVDEICAQLGFITAWKKGQKHD